MTRSGFLCMCSEQVNDVLSPLLVMSGRQALHVFESPLRESTMKDEACVIGNSNVVSRDP